MVAVTHTVPETPWPRATTAWFTVAVLTLGYTVSFVDRTILSLMIDPIKKDLDLSDTQIALLQGLAFAVFYVGMGLPLGWLVDRVSRKGVIVAGVTTWCLATAACGTSASFWQIFLARVGVGAGEATLSPAAISMIGDNFPPEKRAFPISIYSSASTVGAGLAIIIGGMAVQAISSMSHVTLPLLGDVAPWRAVFVIVGLSGLIVVLLMMFVTEPVRQEQIQKQEKGSEFLAHLSRNRAFHILHLGGMSLYSILIYGLLSWMPAFFTRTFGWTAGEVGLRYGLVVLLFGGFGISAAGWLSSSLASRGVRAASSKICGISILIATPLVAAACMQKDGWLAIAILAPAMVAFTASGGLAVAALCEPAPGTVRGQTAALYYFMLSMIGLALGPLSIALITDHVFQDPRALGPALSIAMGTLGPVAGIIVLLSIPSFNRAVAARQALAV